MLFSDDHPATYAELASVLSDLSEATSDNSTSEIGLFPSDINITNLILHEAISFLASSAEEGDQAPLAEVSRLSIDIVTWAIRNGVDFASAKQLMLYHDPCWKYVYYGCELFSEK